MGVHMYMQENCNLYLSTNTQFIFEQKSTKIFEAQSDNHLVGDGIVRTLAEQDLNHFVVAAAGRHVKAGLALLIWKHVDNV